MNTQYLIVGAGRILQILIALAGMRLMTHLLSGAEVGNFYLILSLVAYFSLVFLSPVGLYMNRRLHKWHQEGNLLNYFACYNVYVALVSLAAALFLFLGRKFFGIGSGISPAALCFLAAAYIYFGTWNSTLIPALNMLNYRKSFTALSTGTLLLGLASAVALAKLYAPSAVLWLSGQIAALFALSAAALAYLLLKIKDKPDMGYVWARIKTPELSGVLKFSLPLLVSAFFMWLQNQSYRLIVEKYLGLDFLGSIAVGLGIAAAIAAAAESLVQQIYYPLYYSEINTPDAGKRKFAWDKMAGVMIPLYLLLTIFVSFLSWHLVNLLVDAKFRSAWIFTVFGAWVEFARITTNILSTVAHSEMRTESITKPYMYGGLFTAAGVFMASRSSAYTYLVPAALVLGGFITLFLMFKSMRSVMRFSLAVGPLKLALLLALPFPLALLVKNPQGSIPVSILILALFGAYMAAGQYLLYKKQNAGGLNG
ncbi:MAG: hypothetical protein A2X28_01875 [Elusimicrobia bacterium GWA2_56_46]|nr:MAG: hypothetical protein A2X28_01875 [Elusimicrobia bacterium GWA2_56_46]OGR55481.1 MAG: hypothetical protein A2X39_01090 [Elusimicrobia bacterium GWC2_56_31]HBW21949.1 hypothetical protein [Elusimicrobiota bacterium]